MFPFKPISLAFFLLWKWVPNDTFPFSSVSSYRPYSVSTVGDPLPIQSSSPQDILTLTIASVGVPKLTELGFDNSLESLAELRAVTVRVMIYYSKRTQVKIGQGKRCIGQGPGELQAQSFRLPPPGGAGDSATFPRNGA